jgi:hypothetical protein
VRLCLQLICASVSPFLERHSTCSGPGDIVAVMGIAVSLRMDIYLYLPPHDDAQKWSANVHYKSLQFRCATALRNKPCIYLVIRGGHFKALAAATSAPNPKQSFTVMDLFQTEVDPATSKCADVCSCENVMLSIRYLYKIVAVD